MKTKIVLLALAIFGLLSMSSCTVYVDDAGGIVGTGFQPVRAGLGFLPQSPLACGPVIAAGGIQTNSPCDPRGFSGRGGFQTYPAQFYPQGSRFSPGHPCNYPGYNQVGNPNWAAPGQANWYRPNYGFGGPQPAQFGRGCGGIPYGWH